MVNSPLKQRARRRWLRPLAAASLALLILAWAPAPRGHGRQEPARVEKWMSELQKDLTGLEAFASSRDLDALEAVVNRDSAKWERRSRQFFVEYMLKACGLLSSYSIGDQSRRSLLLSRYAMAVLKGGGLPLREHVQFVEFLTQDPLAIDEAVWSKLREQKARLWLEAWRRVEGSIAPNFDFSDLPSLKVPAPAATGLPAGVAPESIKDPKARTEYEAAVAQNAAKIERYNDQHWLKMNAPSFFKAAERYLVNAYTRPPADPAGLERLLSEYPGGEDAARRILEAVRQQEQK
ncbi:MAG: hypothetical protein ABW250_06875 [Pyrinomonadaceae bacterium]